MDIRALQYFLAVAEEENISHAAEALHVTQPTLSRQMMDLEAEIGKILFIRGKRRLSLTDEGILLRKRATEILDLVDKTQSELRDLSDHVTGDVFIGSGETDALRLLARSAKALQRRYPGIHFHISSGDGADVSEKLEKGLIDFGVFIGKVDDRKYDGLQLPYQDVWGALIPREHPLSAKEMVEPRELWDEPLILSRQVREGSFFTKWIGRNLSQLNIVGTYSLIYNASLLASEGLGLALGLDKLINTTGDSTLCFRPFSPRLTVDVHVVWKKYQVFSTAARKFLEQLQEDFGNQSL